MKATTLHRRAVLKTVSLGAAGLALAPSIVQRSLADPATPAMSLPRSAPEEQGVSSAAVLKFIAAWDQSRERLRSEPHSFMLVRHGHVVAETWWAPYSADATHTLSSLTKVWISTAVGLAVADGLFKLEDPLLGFFPDEAPSDPSTNLQAMTVRDLLIGGTGHTREDIAAFGWELDSEQRVRKFMVTPVTFRPGTHFAYNPPASLLLMNVVEKASRLPAGAVSSAWVRKVNRRTFKLESNAIHATRVTFDFDGNTCQFILADDKGTHGVRCGLGKWMGGTTSMPQTPPLPLWGAFFPRLDKVAGAAAWTAPNVLEMQWRFYETPDYYAVTCRFEDEAVAIEFRNSIDEKLALSRLPSLRGRAAGLTRNT